MYMHHSHSWCPGRPEEGSIFPGTGIVDECEPLCACWELNLGLLGEEQGLLTSELSLQTPIINITKTDFSSRLISRIFIARERSHSLHLMTQNNTESYLKD